MREDFLAALGKIPRPAIAIRDGSPTNARETAALMRVERNVLCTARVSRRRLT